MAHSFSKEENLWIENTLIFVDEYEEDVTFKYYTCVDGCGAFLDVVSCTTIEEEFEILVSDSKLSSPVEFIMDFIDGLEEEMFLSDIITRVVNVQPRESDEDEKS